MSPNIITVEQPIYCNSYEDALEISNAFDGFSFKFIGLGRVQTIKARRRITRENTSSVYSHCVKIIYRIPYREDFLDYGFIDERAKQKYPNLIKELLAEDPLERWRVVFKYQELEDQLCRDIYFYESFRKFFENCLKEYLNQIFISTIISFAGCYHCDAFIIHYIENMMPYEFAYFACNQEGIYSSYDVRECYPECNIAPISMSQCWSWVKTATYDKRGRYDAEHRSLTSLTYTLNRTPSEKLFYAVVGLESIYTKGEKNIRKQLSTGILQTFPFMAKEDILTIYKLRSEFAHGDIIFPLYYDQHDTSWRASNYFKPAKSASALLLLSIRELVRQDRQDLYIENSENYSSGELLEIANNLLQGILTANSYWQILQQYKKNVDSYAAEMHCSPAFYNTIYLSLVESMYISLSKLYDWDDRSLTLRVLLNNTKYITEETLDEDVLKKYTFCGNKFQRSLSAYEEPFFNKEVADTKKILSLFGHQYHYTTVELSLEETFSLYKNWFKSMQDRKLIKNLMEQRSKIHAHNDKLTNFDYNAVWDEYPLTEDNIEELLAFSIDFIQFFIGILTGIQKAVEYTNIDDWGATLTLVREGQDHLNKQLNEF